MSRRAEPRRIAVPAAARRRSTLRRIDYADAFVVAIGGGPERTADQWARTMLEQAPAETRAALRRGWAMLGLKLGSPDDDARVLGWELRRRSPEIALLGAGSRFGLHGEVLFERQDGTLLLATFVELRNPLARALWTVIAPAHRRVVRSLLAAGVRRERIGR